MAFREEVRLPARVFGAAGFGAVDAGGAGLESEDDLRVLGIDFDFRDSMARAGRW